MCHAVWDSHWSGLGSVSLYPGLEAGLGLGGLVDNRNAKVD